MRMRSFFLGFFDPVGAIYRDIEYEMEADYLGDLIEVAKEKLSPLLEQTSRLISNHPDDLLASFPSVSEAARRNGRELTKPCIKVQITVPSQKPHTHKRSVAGFYIIKQDFSERAIAPLTITLHDSKGRVIYSATAEELQGEHIPRLYAGQLDFLKTCHF